MRGTVRAAETRVGGIEKGSGCKFGEKGETKNRHPGSMWCLGHSEAPGPARVGGTNWKE